MHLHPLRCLALLLAAVVMLAPLAGFIEACDDCATEAADCCMPGCASCSCCARLAGLALSVGDQMGWADGSPLAEAAAAHSSTADPRDVFHVPKPALA